MKFYNEFNEEIPSDIVHKAEAMECYSVKYIYQDDKEYRCFPASNLNVKGESRPFRSDESAKEYKEPVGSFNEVKWVVYSSPTGSRTKI